MLPYMLVFALSAAVTPADARPLALSEIDDAARYVFECARDSRWKEAEAQLETLEHAYEDLPSGLRPSDVAAGLRTRVRQLPDMVANRDRLRTMETANATTEFVMELSGAFHSRVPEQLPRLGYLGRQIEYEIAAQQPAAIKQTTAEIRQTWNELRPELERRGHQADVRRMTDVVVSLEMAGHAPDEASLARAELDVVSHLEAELK